MNNTLVKTTKVLGLTTLLAMTTSVQAETISKVDYCKVFEGLSTSIMKSRQNEVAMSKMMTLVDEKLAEDKAVRNIAHTMVVSAYNEPAFSSEEYKDRSVKRFSNKWFKECLINTSLFLPDTM